MIEVSEVAQLETEARLADDEYRLARAAFEAACSRRRETARALKAARSPAAVAARRREAAKVAWVSEQRIRGALESREGGGGLRHDETAASLAAAADVTLEEASAYLMRFHPLHASAGSAGRT